MLYIEVHGEGENFRLNWSHDPKSGTLFVQLASSRDSVSPNTTLSVAGGMSRHVLIEAFLRLCAATDMPSWATKLKASFLGFLNSMTDEFFGAYLVESPHRENRQWHT